MVRTLRTLTVSTDLRTVVLAKTSNKTIQAHLLSVDRLSAGSVVIGEVSALQHEAWELAGPSLRLSDLPLDTSMEARPSIRKLHTLSIRLLSNTELLEVVGGLSISCAVVEGYRSLTFGTTSSNSSKVSLPAGASPMVMSK